jgi:predicted transcriptional regulator
MMFSPISAIEMEVYDLVSKKYLKKHKDLTVETILPFCFKTLSRKYSQTDLSTAVTNLISKRYFIKGSSLSRDDVLHNPVRKEILQFIRVNPGCYNRLVRRKLNIGSNEFNWHLGMLEKFGFIKRIQFDRSFGYFENRNFMGFEYDLFLLQNDKVEKIIAFLQNNKGTLSQIAKELDMHYSTVQKYLEILEVRQFLKIKTFGKHAFYELNDDLMIKLRKIVNGAVFVEFAD